MLEEGHYYLYDGPTWLSGEVSYGDTLKYVGRSVMSFFSVVQKLGELDKYEFEVPTEHLKPLRSLRDPAIKIDQVIHSDPYIKTSAEGITMEDLNKGHVTTLEEHQANPQRVRNVRVDFARFMEYIGTILPAGKSRDNAFERLHEASMWAHKAMEEMATKEEPSPKIEFNLDVPALQEHLKKTLLKKYAGWREYNESDYDFLVRLTRKGTINPEEFAAVYGKRIHEVYDPEVDDPTPDTNAHG